MATPTRQAWHGKPFSLITATPYLRYFSALPAGQDAVRVARLMALTHNTVFRALNSVYVQADAVDPLNIRDVVSFTSFATFAIDFLENHHQCEELVFFPMLEAKAGVPGLMGNNVEQHRAFDLPLGALRNYLDSARRGRTALDAASLRDRIDALAPALECHLHDEIPSILAAGTRMSDEAMSACYKALHDEAEGTTDMFKIGPLVLGCQDNTMLLDGLRIQFPELPFSLAPYLVEHFVSRRHADVWRFCPSTFHGDPRETEFFGSGGSLATSKTVSKKRAIVDFWPLAVSAFLLLLVVFVTTKRMSGLPMAGYLMQ